MKIAGITYDSIVDGPGLRVVVFAQGCHHECKGCQNPESWDPTGGTTYTARELTRMLKKKRPGRELIRGVTFSGGEPFLQGEALGEVAQAVKKLGWDVVTYTGYTLEALMASQDPGVAALLAQTDYLIDGPYIAAQRSLNVKFRGSDNQRIIDMNATRAKGETVLYDM